MTQPLAERAHYHPTIDAPRGGDRRVLERLEAIRARVDLRGKTVLDLGCSGGFFSFSVARDAARVVGVDGDGEMIEADRREATRRGTHNVEFVHGVITPELLAPMPRYDVVLFLSVFHHMLTASSAYGWNAGASVEAAFRTLAAVRDKADVLIFEMGYPTEDYEWAARLPPMRPDPRAWVLREVFGPEFPHVEVVEPMGRGMLGGVRRRVGALPQRSLLGRGLRRALRMDERESRDLFVGRR